MENYNTPDQFDREKIIDDTNLFIHLIEEGINWLNLTDIEIYNQFKNVFTNLTNKRNGLEDYKLRVKSLIKIDGEYINRDIKGMENNVLSLKNAFDQLESSLMYDYWEDNVSDFITYGDCVVFNKVAVRVKGIPINSAVLPEGFKVRILDDFVEDEYAYEIYLDKCDKYEEVDCIYDQFRDLITDLLKDMLTHYEERNDIYNSYLYKQMGKIQESYPSNNYKLNILEEPLYKWQSEAYNAWVNSEYKGTFEVATGCGKTKFALYSIQKVKEINNNIKVRIIVPSKALMKNWYDNLIMKLHVPPKCIGRKGNGFNDQGREITIYIDETARNPEKFQRDFLRVIFDNMLREEKYTNFIIADECHHYESSENIKIFNNLDKMPQYEGTLVNYYAMGLSATLPAEYNDKGNLKNYIGKNIYTYSFVKALTDDIISPVNIINVSYSLTEEERKEFYLCKKYFDKAEDDLKKVLDKHSIQIEEERMEYYAFKTLRKNSSKADMISEKKKQLMKEYGALWQQEHIKFLEENGDKFLEIVNYVMDYVYKLVRFRKVLFSAEDRKNKCIEIAKKHSDDKMIIFGEYIKDMNDIYLELLSEFGKEKVKQYHSDMSEKVKKEVLESLHLNTTKIICVPTALDEGVDIPDMAVSIVYQGKKSQRQQVQRLGRIIRKSEGKSQAIMYHLHNKEYYEDEFLDKFIMEQKDEIKNMDNAAQILEIINERLRIDNI